MLKKQNLIKVGIESVDKAAIVVDKKAEEIVEESGEESESDNEEIIVCEPTAVVGKSDDVNLDDEFEKIVAFKFRRLSEESSDEVDHEIEEILCDAEPLEKELESQTEVNSEIKAQEFVVEEFRPVVEVVADEQENSSEVEVEQKPSDSIESKPIEETSINDAKPTETIIDEELLPKDTKENTDEQKPPVPIQTYLWEDVKRSKEQVSGDNVCTSICSVPSESLKVLSNKQLTRNSF